jgi:hypothetical protein
VQARSRAARTTRRRGQPALAARAQPRASARRPDRRPAGRGHGQLRRRLRSPGGAGPHEIQFGILKRLRGAPIGRHTSAFALDFDPAPPYAVRATREIDAPTMRRIARMAQAWDRVANSGRFARTLALLLGAPGEGEAFWWFLAFSDAVTAVAGQPHGLSPESLGAHLHDWLCANGHPPAVVADAVRRDYAGSGARGRLAIPGGPARAPTRATAQRATLPRQTRHLSG